MSLSQTHLHHASMYQAHSARHYVGLSPTLNFKNMSQALNLHYLWPWLDVALLSQAYVLHVFQRCWKTSRDFTDMPQSDTDNIHLAAIATALTSMYSWLFPIEIIASHFWNCPIMSRHRQNICLLSSCSPSFFFDHSSKGNLERHFPDNMWILNQRSWRWLKTKLCWISEQKRKDSSTVQIKPQRIKATVPLHHVYTLILIWRNQDCS